MRSQLPKEIFDKIDSKSIQRSNTNYVSKELQETMSDIVYDANFEEFPIKLTFIIEHKSYIPDYPFIQLLKYFINCLEEQIKQKEKKKHFQLALPLIMVVYHGEKSWEVKQIWEYFNNIPEILRIFVPTFQYLLTDLTKDDYEKIKKNYDSFILQISFMTMKGAFDAKNYEQNVNYIFSDLPTILETEMGEIFFETLIKYILNKMEIDGDKLITAINEITEKGGNKVMTIAENFLKQGRQEGIEQGIEQGIVQGIVQGIEEGIEEGIIIEKAKNALRLFVKNYEINIIIEITELSENEVKLLLALYNQFEDSAIEHIEIIEGKVCMK